MSKWTVGQLGIACFLVLAVIASELLREKVFVPSTDGGSVLSPLYFISVLVIVFLALHCFCYLELQKEKNIFQHPIASYIGRISFVALLLFIISTMTAFVSFPITQITSDFRFMIYGFIFIGLALIYFTLFGFIRAFVTDEYSSVTKTVKWTTGAGLGLSLIAFMF